MELDTRQAGPFLVVSVPDTRIDAAAAIGFKDAMRAATTPQGGDVILNLTTVTFIDSSGLGAIVAAMKGLGRDRKMALAGLTPTVEKVFRLTRMDSVFQLFPTLDAALNTLTATHNAKAT